MNQPVRFSALIFGATLLFTGCSSSLDRSLAIDSPAATPGSADTFSPKYEYAGHWLADGDPLQVVTTRHGKHVTAIYNNNSYKHVFIGDYVNGTTITGIQTRLKLADQTTTRMRLTDTFLSPTSIRVDWVALDGNSDLAEGQTGVSFLERTPTVLERAPTLQQPAPILDTGLRGADEGFSPQYEYAGHWLADGEPTPSDVTRQGKHVVSTYNNSGYKHVFVGDYVNGTTIKGIQTRLKLADQTTTRMYLILTFLSPNSIRFDWVGLDSNSDLAEGQIGVSFLKRAPTMPQRIPVILPRAPAIPQPAPTPDDGLRGVD